jgi:hypothetical protein
MADWRHFTRHLRICSFSVKPDNLNCWQRFADYHRGCVIRFHASELTLEPTEDELPQKIEYKNIRPEITSLREQLNAAIHHEHLNLQKDFAEKFLCKSNTLNGEQEWRCFYNALSEPSSKSNNDMEWFDDRPFPNQAINAIYFGAYMSVEDKKKILAIQKSHYPSARIFQAQPVHGKYEIEFVRITR